MILNVRDLALKLETTLEVQLSELHLQVLSESERLCRQRCAAAAKGLEGIAGGRPGYTASESGSLSNVTDAELGLARNDVALLRKMLHEQNALDGQHNHAYRDRDAEKSGFSDTPPPSTFDA